jgi:hypothetical protein
MVLSQAARFCFILLRIGCWWRIKELCDMHSLMLGKEGWACVIIPRFSPVLFQKSFYQAPEIKQKVGEHV